MSIWNRRRGSRSLQQSAVALAARKCACELLESRRLLTSVLYLDFGDNFPAGGLQTTVQTLRQSFGSSGLQGPDLRQSDVAATTTVNEALVDGDNLNFAPTAPLVTTDYNNDGSVNATDFTDLKNNVLTLAQRYYQPFDVNVQFAPAVGDLGTSADYINDARTQLQLGANTIGEYDGWIFLSNVTRVSDGASIGAITSNFGISNGGDIDNANAADNTEIAFTDQIFGAATVTDIDTRLAYTAAHEGGHDFGLRHTNNGSGTSGSASTDADLLLQTGSNLVTGSAPSGIRTSTVMVTRFPLVRGDNNNNTSPNTFNINDTRVPYDQLANNNNLGLRAGAAAYVTGSGAFDKITITSAGGGMANVSVETHRDNTFANQIGSTYSYSVPLANGILIDAGRSDDRIILDATIAANVTLRGMAGNDQLIANGNGLASATYTPGSATQTLIDDSTSFTGQLNFAGGANVRIEEFETTGSVTVQNVSNLTLVTPNGADNLTVDSPTAGTMRVAGTSGGVGIVPLSLTNVTNLIIDAATNGAGATNDLVTISASSVATGLATIAVNTGGGSDELDVNFAPGNPIPTGGLSFNAGTGANDFLNLRGGSFATEVYTPSGPHSGSIVLGGSSTITYSNLAPINDTVTVANFTFNATAGADTINVIDSTTFNGVDTTQINSGNGTFELVNFGNKASFRIEGQGGADTFNVSGSDPADGLTELILDGEDQTNTGDDLAGDLFNITAALPGIPTRAFGGGGADTFNFTGSGAGVGASVFLDGQAGNDQFNVTASANAPLSVTGGSETDVLAVDGDGATFVVGNTTFTSVGLQTITYTTVERLDVSDGTFQVSGVVTTPFHVNNAASLIGTGTASGGITVNTGGTVAPGVGGPGILGSGNLLFTSGAYSVDINGTTPGTLHDQLNVTGSVNLGAGVAALSANIGYTSVPGDEIVIIRNDGADAVAGFFAGAAQGAIFDFGGGQKFTIDYGFEADGDGNFNDVALIRYGAALAPDPCDPTKLALFVSSTAGDDEIRLVPSNGNKNIKVLINGNDEGTFRPTGGVYVLGQNGNDLIVSEMPSHEVVLYGNAGNDTLISGNSDSILIGGYGDDLLQSGNGKDILIGGRGADTLDSGNGTDIVISGYSDYEATNNAARMTLCQIKDAWHTGGKVSSVSSYLNASTMHDDTSVDRLLGGQGNDWLAGNTTGGTAIDIFDLVGKDTVTDLV